MFCSWLRFGFRFVRVSGVTLVLSAGLSDSQLWAQASPINRMERVNYEEAPIRYSNSTPNDAVTQLQQQLDSGQLTITGATPQEKLSQVLDALSIPTSSQVLTFGRTSLQSDKVSPQTPRAIYYNDSTFVGHMPEGVIEVAVVDSQLGVNFYTFDPAAEAVPAFVRETNRCLTCHGAAKSLYVPGLQVRSVLTDPEGHPVLSAGSRRTDHSSPFEERWGGWYVTGTHGAMRHRGNMQLPDDQKPKALDLESGANLLDLSKRFPVDQYLSPHSDLVSLMVLEHQADAINALTRAKYVAAKAQADCEAAIAGGLSADEANAARQSRLQAAADIVADYLTFQTELVWSEPIAGSGDFATEFAECGDCDAKGRSLREFDLKQRLFRYRCSYLVHSPAFLGLETDLRQAVAKSIVKRLEQPATEGEEAELAERRSETLEILRETHPDFGVDR